MRFEVHGPRTRRAFTGRVCHKWTLAARVYHRCGNGAVARHGNSRTTPSASDSCSMSFESAAGTPASAISVCVNQAASTNRQAFVEVSLRAPATASVSIRRRLVLSPFRAILQQCEERRRCCHVDIRGRSLVSADFVSGLAGDRNYDDCRYAESEHEGLIALNYKTGAYG